MWLLERQTRGAVIEHLIEWNAAGVGYEDENHRVVWWPDTTTPEPPGPPTTTLSPHLGEAGTIVLSRNGELYYCWYEDYVAGEWNGYIKEGVIVVPSSHMPDGKARMMALSGVSDTDGTASASWSGLEWSVRYNIENGLTDYSDIVTFENNPEDEWYDAVYHHGNAPCNHPSFSAYTASTVCWTDPVCYYVPVHDDLKEIPSPYISGTSLNPDFRVRPSYNVVCDLDGAVNTEILASANTEYDINFPAATACWNFTNGDNGGLFTSAHTWYLPAMGELIYLSPRFAEINGALEAVGAQNLYSNNVTGYGVWSSSQNGHDNIWVYNGWSFIQAGHANSRQDYGVIPFTKIP